MFTNYNGKAFASDTLSTGEVYEKNTTLWTDFIGGFGIDAELFDRIATEYETLVFVVKKPLKSYKTNKVVCEKGKYAISIAKIQQLLAEKSIRCQKATLNERHGRQLFVSQYLTEKIA